MRRIAALLLLSSLAVTPLGAQEKRPFQDPPWDTTKLSPLQAAQSHPKEDGFDRLPPVQKVALGFFVMAVAMAGGIGALAFLCLFSVTCPSVLRSGSDVLGRHPVRSFIAGVLTLLVFLFATAIIEHLPGLLQALLGLTIMLSFAALLISGLGITVFELGERIIANTNARGVGSSFLTVLYGGFLFLCLGLLPGLGQLAQLVLALMGFGVAVSLAAGKLRRKKAEPKMDEPSFREIEELAPKSSSDEPGTAPIEATL